MPLGGRQLATCNRNSFMPAKVPALRPLQIQATWRDGSLQVPSD
jgi:hypothetical protein